MQYFYSEKVAPGLISLNEEESRHAAKSLRLTAGDQVVLVDGKGTRGLAQITDLSPTAVHATVGEVQQDFQKRNYKVSLAISPTKNRDRLEWCVEKLTEIGVDDIYLLKCSRTERNTVNLERLMKIALSAMKQSQQAYLPVIHPLISLDEFLTLEHHPEKWIGYCDQDKAPTLTSVIEKGENAAIMIGPEGDFTQEEVECAQSKGFQTMRLGEQRYRTETAAIVACQTIHTCNG